MRVLSFAVIALVAAQFCGPSLAAAQSPSDAPLATRQNFFTIPFTAPETSSGQPVEVHLYVSADRGRSWQLYSRQTPRAGKFDFRAQQDGEYWFASRTVTASAPAQRVHGPELRVLVDTVGPRLDLNAGVGPSGEVQTTWAIADPNLVVDSFKVFFRHDNAEQWQPGAVELPRGEQRTQLGGTTSWWPQRHGSGLEVRAEVQDRAGNMNVVQRKLQLPNLARGQRPALAQNDRPESHPSIQWPADEVLNRTPKVQETHQPVPQQAEIQGEVAHQVIAPFQLPPGERPQMTQHNRFNLAYDLDGVGPSGVASVQLWATRDGGRVWQQWAVDEDRRSPFPIEIADEGMYGFRIVVQSGNGLSGEIPQSGDEAEVWIGLDQTPPHAAITSARYGRGQEVGTLSIFWEAKDEVLSPRPITLMFSDNPRGPWTTLAAGLENSGQYQWRVDGSVPAQIYLRLEVRDAAGNVGVHQIDRPIANDGLVPRGRIRGIQPLEDAAQEASRRWPLR